MSLPSPKTCGPLILSQAYSISPPITCRSSARNSAGARPARFGDVVTTRGGRRRAGPRSSPGEPPVDLGVLPRGAVPPEILRHAVALHLTPCIAIAIYVDGALDRGEERGGLGFVEYETGSRARGGGLAVAIDHRID